MPNRSLVIAAWLLMMLVVSAAAAQPPTSHRLRFTASLPLVLVELTPDDHTWFAIDTGATGTTVVPEVAERLALEVTGGAQLTTLAGRASTQVVRLATLRIGGAVHTHEVQAAVHDLSELRRLAPDAEGILGQDVLAAYDYLIDYRRGRLTLGDFEPPPRGVAMPLSWSAGRPLVHVRGRVSWHALVLDSGSDALVLDVRSAADVVGEVAGWTRSRAALRTHFGERAVDVERHGRLQLANLSLSGVDVVRLSADAWQLSPESGLLPAVLFDRVYVSARTGRAAVWPRRR